MRLLKFILLIIYEIGNKTDVQRISTLLKFNYKLIHHNILTILTDVQGVPQKFKI